RCGAILFSGLGNSGCRSSDMPYSEVNSSRYSWEMVDMAVSDMPYSEEYLLEFTSEYGISETAISTISQEYLLEFTSEYGISEDLHPELPSPEKRIVDFPEGKSTIGGKSLASMGLETGSTFPVPTSQETPTDVIDPDPLSFKNPQPIPKENVAQSSKGVAVAGDPESKNTSFTSMVGSPESIYQSE
nr:hypothetical protein [Tanacetum cinerariifolium]